MTMNINFMQTRAQIHKTGKGRKMFSRLYGGIRSITDLIYVYVYVYPHIHKHTFIHQR